MLKRIRVNNFRCLQNNLEILFEDDLTVIVGENDSGKTSLVDAIKIALQQKEIEPEDFSYGTDEVEIELETKDSKFIMRYNLDENNQISSKRFLVLSKNELREYKEKIEKDFLDDNYLEALKNLADLLGVTYRNNTRADTLKINLVGKIDEYLSNPGDPILVDTKSKPNINLYALDGKDFEEISSFIKKLFFEKKKKEIWHELVSENDTIESLVKKQLSTYEAEINKNVNEGNITKKIREFLPSLTEIVISSDFRLPDINIDVKVKFLESDKEILVNKKGDGTKRRITMALLDYKNEIQSEEEIGNNVYLFDEPDTHLHVRAQKELMNIIEKFGKSGRQVIIATHSPFIINSCKPKQIRLLTNINNVSTVKFMKRDEEIENLLRNIGIENIYLFFAKKILIVEGETEEKFIPIMFEKLFNSNLHSNLIKIINVMGIKNVPGFARALLELIDKDNIYVLIDNDIEETTSTLIKQLDLDETHIFKVGNKEFEDSFEASTIYRCWKKYVEERGKRVGDMWTKENIDKLKYECILNEKKFSDEIRKLNDGCVIKLNKVNLGIALGEYCEEDELDVNLRELLWKLKN